MKYNSLIKTIYRQKGGLKTKIIHKAILSCIKNIPKLSEWNKSLFKKYSNTPSWDNAILNFHTAKDPKALDLKSPSFMRLAYDEMLAKQLSLAIIRKNILEDKGNSYNNKKNQLVIKFTKMLPFKITQNQNDIINEIIDDLNSSKKMLRLLHGDVGSGKTVVAIASALYVINSGYQVALMVPTELLAIQHYNQVKQLFDKLKLKVYLLTSSSEKKSEILKISKFNFCFGNIYGLDGYISEKLLDSINFGSVPIYYPSYEIEKKFFPSELYYDYRDFENFESLIDFMENFDERAYNNWRSLAQDFLPNLKKRHSIENFINRIDVGLNNILNINI